MVLSIVKRALGMHEKGGEEDPKTSMDMILTLAEAIRLGYPEIEKWNNLDLPRSIRYAVMDKGKKTVAMECRKRNDCVELKDPEVLRELYEIRSCLGRTMLFSQKSFRDFLSDAGFLEEDVLLRKRTAGILKPVFSVIRDRESKCLIVFIQSSSNIKETLTDAICGPVTFNHFVCSDGDLKGNNVVSGHGHRGMVAAARWIRDRCVPALLNELRQYPDFQIKIVGHSLAGGTAALLTYMLREIVEFSSCTCVTFGTPACVSLELAELGKPFITSVINGYDIVPTLSVSSVHDFISQGRIKRKKFMNRPVGSRLPYASRAKATASPRTADVMKNKQRTQSEITLPRPENNVPLSSSKSENLAEASRSSETSYEVTEELMISKFTTNDVEGSKSSSKGSPNDDMDEEQITIPTFSDDKLNQNLKELQLEAQDDTPNSHGANEKQAATEKGITEAEMNVEVVRSEESSSGAVATSHNLRRNSFYPPGRIMHISFENSKTNHHDDTYEEKLVLYETTPELYEKLRLSRGMIFDHLPSKYLKVLQQLINQFEREKFEHGW